MLHCSNGHSTAVDRVQISSNQLALRYHTEGTHDANHSLSSSFCKEVMGVNGLVQQMIHKFSDGSSPKIHNGEAKSPNDLIGRSSTRSQSAARKANGSLLSPTESSVGKTWCITSGIANYSSPSPRNSPATAHPGTPRSVTSPTPGSPVKLTAVNGNQLASELYSRSRLRRTSTKSDSSSADGAKCSPTTGSPVQLKFNGDSECTPRNGFHQSYNNGYNESQVLVNGVTNRFSTQSDLASVRCEGDLFLDTVAEDIQHRTTTSEVLEEIPVKLREVIESTDDAPVSKSNSSDKETVSQPNAEKNGRFYLGVVDEEEIRINTLCKDAEKDLDSPGLSDEAAGKVRSAIGKAHLLTAKKFQQFRDLCHKNLTQDQDEPFPTTSQDLAGFWDLVMIQIDDVNGLFSEIDILRKNEWKEPKSESSGIVPSSPTQSTAANLSTTRHSSVKSKPANNRREAAAASTTTTVKSDAAKARDEARQRLLAAKAAGRQRKASDTESNEVQIFIS